MLVPGGASGDGCCDPGGAVGFCVGRACSGTGWLRSVPGGRVASCCVGFTGGVGEGVGVCAMTAPVQHKSENRITLKLMRTIFSNIKMKTPSSRKSERRTL